MIMRVKICGLNNEAAVQAAVSAGADFAGLVSFEKSPRHVSLEQAATLKALLPPHIRSVIVLVDPDDALLADIFRTVQPDFFQLHGTETPGRLYDIRSHFPAVGLIKAIPVSSAQDVLIAEAFRTFASYILFDAKAPNDTSLPGGRGESFDWSLLANAEIPLPWFLSGGLTPENVAEAIQKTGAQMVDVSSGVESAPGVKDAALIQAFVKAVKNSQLQC